MNEQEANTIFTADVTITAPLCTFLSLQEMAIETAERWAIEEDEDAFIPDDERIAVRLRPSIAESGKLLLRKIKIAEEALRKHILKDGSAHGLILRQEARK